MITDLTDYNCRARDGNLCYDVSMFSCPDVDECLLANMCPGQLCLNTPGSYTCRSCGVGLQLSEDGYGCEGKTTSVFIYLLGTVCHFRKHWNKITVNDSKNEMN